MRYKLWIASTAVVFCCLVPTGKNAVAQNSGKPPAKSVTGQTPARPVSASTPQPARKQPARPASDQSPPSTVAAQPAPTVAVRVVAGIVGEGGTVRYLPRVAVRLMPKEYLDAERAATETYSAEVEGLRQTRDAKIKNLVAGRRSDLAVATTEHAKQLQAALDRATLDPLSVTPSCLSYNSLDRNYTVCSERYRIGQQVSLSMDLRRLLVHPAVIGNFDVHTFSKGNAPVVHDRFGSLSAVPLEVYQQVPEFGKQVGKALSKERDQAKLKKTDKITAAVAKAAVVRFLNEWFKADSRRSSTFYLLDDGALRNFSNVSPDFFPSVAVVIEEGAKRALKTAAEGPLAAFIAAKDKINGNYDSQQAQADAIFRHGAEEAERRRTTALDAALKRTPPALQTATSLSGDVTLNVPGGAFAIIAEDTTTDQHLRWSILLTPENLAARTIELTDANALKATPTTIASPAAQVSYPKAKDLSGTDRAEYGLRYGSKLLNAWKTTAALHDAEITGDDLSLVDSQLGFAFEVRATSTSVFNTLRMTDNDIASRFFKDLAAPYLQELPQNLRTIGGSQAFEAVSINVLGRKKSFADEYAVGDVFFLTYAFRISDVESYASQKIDAQQLLDRAHVTHDKIGRISVKLVSAQ